MIPGPRMKHLNRQLLRNAALDFPSIINGVPHFAGTQAKFPTDLMHYMKLR